MRIGVWVRKYEIVTGQVHFESLILNQNRRKIQTPTKILRKIYTFYVLKQNFYKNFAEFKVLFNDSNFTSSSIPPNKKK